MASSGNAETRVQSFGEELANSISHGLGALAALIFAPILIWGAMQRWDDFSVIGAIVFATCVVLLYLTSTIYHALPQSKFKNFFQVLDHAAIYLMIAGTYTPFTLGVLKGTWGWILFGAVWTIALIGLFVKARYGANASKLSTALYLVMGWFVVIAIKPLLMNMAPWGLFWLLAGGICYTAGVVFFALDKKVRYAHFIWHLFVLAGTASHFVAVFFYSYGHGGS